MSLIDLIVVLLVLGLILYLIKLAPIDAQIKQIIIAIAIVIILVWLLRAFIPDVRIMK